MPAADCFPVYEFAEDAVEPAVNWVWHGFLGRSETTLLTCQWKAGKTTLLAMLIDRMKEGGQLAGLPVSRGQAIVVSEEKEKDWARRNARYRLRGHCRVLCRPFAGGKPRLGEWLKLMERLDQLHRARPADLLAIDTLSSLLPGHAENDATLMVNALGPLQEIARTGPAILLLHHPRKLPAAAGMAARGTGALAGLVDIIMEMTYYRPGAELDRRRRLTAYSRHDATLPQQILELSEDGGDYAARGDFEFDEFNQRWQELAAVLAPSTVKLSRGEIFARWPAATRPAAVTLWRWLERAVQQERLRKDGSGTPAEPFRYWLPELEQRWQTDFLARLDQDHQDAARALGDLYRPPSSASADQPAAAGPQQPARPA